MKRYGDTLFCGGGNVIVTLGLINDCSTQLAPANLTLSRVYDQTDDDLWAKGHGALLKYLPAEQQIVRYLLAPVVSIHRPIDGETEHVTNTAISIQYSATMHCTWGGASPNHAQAILKSTSGTILGHSKGNSPGSGNSLEFSGTFLVEPSSVGTSAIFVVEIKDASGSACTYPTHLAAALIPTNNDYWGGDAAGVKIIIAFPQGFIKEFPVLSTLRPRKIAKGSDGALWFTAGNAIGRITTDGVVRVFPLPQSGWFAEGITPGPDGALWFTESGGGSLGRIGRISTQGHITQYDLPQDESSPKDIIAGPDGALWFTENYPGDIGRITTDGTITKYPLTQTYARPEGITVGPDGALWFCEANNIGRITTDGILTEYPLPPNGVQPSVICDYIASGPDGALWFTVNEPGLAYIGRITTGGVINVYPLPTGSSQGNSAPWGITAGPDGALWFADDNSAHREIGRITTDGTIKEFLVPTQQYDELFGITQGPDGALWFTETGNTPKIGRLTP